LRNFEKYKIETGNPDQIGERMFDCDGTRDGHMIDQNFAAFTRVYKEGKLFWRKIVVIDNSVLSVKFKYQKYIKKTI